MGEKFMDRDGLIGFAVNARRLRDELSDYAKTVSATFLPNIYTKKYLEIVTALESLVDVLRDEVSARCEQLGEEETRDKKRR